jgi:hypothetical protein
LSLGIALFPFLEGCNNDSVADWYTGHFGWKKIDLSTRKRIEEWKVEVKEALLEKKVWGYSRQNGQSAVRWAGRVYFSFISPAKTW